jgi:hypothetical protein
MLNPVIGYPLQKAMVAAFSKPKKKKAKLEEQDMMDIPVVKRVAILIVKKNPEETTSDKMNDILQKKTNGSTGNDSIPSPENRTFGMGGTQAPFGEALKDVAGKLSHHPKIGKHRHAPDTEFDQNQLAMGIKIEQEHTDCPYMAKEIAKDHLAEIPDYYTRLKKMEEDAKSGR